MKKPCAICEKIASGAFGLTKVGLQLAGVPIDEAAAEEVQRRRDVCRDCDQATRNPKLIDRPSKGLTMTSQCRDCSCVIHAKTRLKSEACPRSKW